MKKTIFTAGISFLIGFSLDIGIANYIIPLFWDQMLITKLGFLVAGTIVLGILVDLLIAKVIWLKVTRLTRNQCILGILLLILCDAIVIHFIPVPGMEKIHNTFEMQVLANTKANPAEAVVVQIFGIDKKKVPIQMLTLSNGWEQVDSSTLALNNGTEASLEYKFLGRPGQSIRVVFTMVNQSRQVIVHSNYRKVSVKFPDAITATPEKIAKSFNVIANPAIGEHLNLIILSSCINFIAIGFLIFLVFLGVVLFFPNRATYLIKYPWINLVPLGILSIVMFWPVSFPVSSDMAYYLSLAKNLYHGRGYVHPDLLPDLYRGPIFPLLISFSYMILGETFRSAMILERIFWVLTIFVTYLLGKRIYNPRVGLIAALLVITTSIINTTYSSVLVDGVMVFVILLLQLITWEVFTKQHGAKWYLLMGFLMGIAYLLKQTSILFTPLPFLMWVIFKEYRTRQVFIKLVFCYGILAIFIFGWMGYIYLAGGSSGQIAGDFQKGLDVISYFYSPSPAKNGASVQPGILQSLKIQIVSLLRMIKSFYIDNIAKYIKIAIIFPIVLVYSIFYAILKKSKADIFLGLSLLLFIPLIPIQAYADFGSRLNLYFFIVVMIFIGAMLDRLFNILPLSKAYKDVFVFVATCCLIFLQVSEGINFTFSTAPKINPETLNYFSDNYPTVDWINANIKPDETILTLLRDGEIFHILTNGNRTIVDINTCIGEVSFVPARSCTPPYILFWIYKGTTDPDDPRDSMLGISEPNFISTIRDKNVKYVIVTLKSYYLYYYLKVHPDFEEVAQLNYNAIFRVIHPVQPISNYPGVKWENCIGKGTPEYLWNLRQTYPARYETMLRDQFGPWMGLSRQDVANVVNWKGCEFESVYPGMYNLP